MKGCQWECRLATGVSGPGTGVITSELHLGHTLVLCLVLGGKGI